MPLPESLKKRITERLCSEKLLNDKSVAALVKNLDASKPINWNIVLNQQVEADHPEDHETDD